MDIDYNHSENLHTLVGPRHALVAMLPRLSVRSLLDVGCGRGTWLKAALDCGIEDITGVDGVTIAADELYFPTRDFNVRDLSQPLDLGRKFDLALCLEVAEHLEAGNAQQLVSNLTRHTDTVLFSAACPGQLGQHHVNCQWPDYWQGLFNDVGYACNDWPRWMIWADSRIEPWYRQNLFVATWDKELAGREPRMMPVINPDMHEALMHKMSKKIGILTRSRIVDGYLPLAWYLKTLIKVVLKKTFRGSSKGSSTNS